jgi:hypothetical protein
VLLFFGDTLEPHSLRSVTVFAADSGSRQGGIGNQILRNQILVVFLSAILKRGEFSKTKYIVEEEEQKTHPSCGSTHGFHRHIPNEDKYGRPNRREARGKSSSYTNLVQDLHRNAASPLFSFLFLFFPFTHTQPLTYFSLLSSDDGNIRLAQSLQKYELDIIR